MLVLSGKSRIGGSRRTGEVDRKLIVTVLGIKGGKRCNWDSMPRQTFSSIDWRSGN
jgi:hypothetical protein